MVQRFQLFIVTLYTLCIFLCMTFFFLVTVFYAFFVCNQIRAGETILIHVGSGGVGQAAINIALYHGLKVYTTVGTKKKREFIMSTWPEIKGKVLIQSFSVCHKQNIYFI